MSVTDSPEMSELHCLDFVHSAGFICAGVSERRGGRGDFQKHLRPVLPSGRSVTPAPHSSSVLTFRVVYETSLEIM